MQSNFDLNQIVTVTPNLLDAYFGYDFVSDDRSMTAVVALEQVLPAYRTRWRWVSWSHTAFMP